MTEINYKDFAKIELATYNLEAFEIDQELALESVAKELEEVVKDLNREETQAARYKHLKIPNATKEDYWEHLIELDQHQKILCGIRHMGGNPDLPFVHLISNFDIQPADLVELYHQKLVDYFKLFKPQYIRYYTADEMNENKMGSCYLVQKAGVIKALPPHSEESKIELIDPVDDSYYDWYKAGYDAFHKANPDLKPHVPINGKGSMEECRKQGLLKMVHSQNEKMGLIAAIREDFLGAKGIYFTEIFINEKYKGKGLAKNIQRKFIDQATQEDDFVWGTIEYQNHPSFKTALANKRLPIRFENFIKI